MIKKTPLTLALDEKKCVVELVKWQDTTGDDAFTYVLIKKNKLSAFKQALSERDVAVSDFGIVVAQGHGKEPPSGLEEAVIASLRKVS